MQSAMLVTHFIGLLVLICLQDVSITSYAFRNNPKIAVFKQVHPFGQEQIRRINGLSLESSSNIQITEPFAKGLVTDIKRKLPFYLSDFTDGLRIKSLSSIVFLFFACLAPAVAFGGVLSAVTGGAIGTTETIGATAIGGVLYALLSGQPVVIIGTTGPLLAFLKALNDACIHQQLPFLPVYTWVGIWSSLLLLLASLFSASNVVDYLTKFTDDIFSTLISIMFLFEAFKGIMQGFISPTVKGLQLGGLYALVSMVVAFTTFLTATNLSALRKTQFLPRKVRGVIADFAPTLGVVAGIKVAQAAMDKYRLSLPMLAFPDAFGTTIGRPWLVDIFAVDDHIKLLTFFPALMSFSLLFMDQTITERLITAKKNKLKKGSGVHLDMLVISLVTLITSLLGMPWMVAATVRSLAHLQSLNEYKSVSEPPLSDRYYELAASSADGVDSSVLELTGVTEQRFTGLMIHGLIGASLIFCRDVLKRIPLCVLSGLFLYLGASSITKTDLYERIKLFVSDPRDVPKNSSWFRTVELHRTKLFTAIQVACLGMMWYIKGTRLGVLFPVLIGLLGPVRLLLEKYNVFTKRELNSLDGEIE